MSSSPRALAWNIAKAVSVILSIISLLSIIIRLSTRASYICYINIIATSFMNVWVVALDLVTSIKIARAVLSTTSRQQKDLNAKSRLKEKLIVILVAIIISDALGIGLFLFGSSTACTGIAIAIANLHIIISLQLLYIVRKGISKTAKLPPQQARRKSFVRRKSQAVALAVAEMIDVQESSKHPESEMWGCSDSNLNRGHR